MQNLILILEDNAERRELFIAVLRELAPECEVRFWQNARVMVEEMPTVLQCACLISLDHDLNEVPASENPGDGLLLAENLAKNTPCCPVIVHSSNYERSWSMLNALSHAGWITEKVGPVCSDWITTLWQPVVAKLLKTSGR